MRRLILVLIGIALLLLAILKLRVWLAAPETRIRWRIEEMVEGFNEARVSPCMKGVAEEWRDGGGRIDRSRLADGLRYTFFQEKDRKTKAFRFRVELEEELVIALDPENEEAATVELLARFDCLRLEEWTATWRVSIEADMIDHEEEGWQVTRTRRETLWSDGRLVGATRR